MYQWDMRLNACQFFNDSFVKPPLKWGMGESLYPTQNNAGDI